MKLRKEKYIQVASRITPPSSYQIGKLSGTNTIQIENIPLQYHKKYLTKNALNLISKSENSLVLHVNFQYPDEDEENKNITLKKKVPQNFHKIMSGFRSQIPFLPNATPTKSIFCPEKSFVPSPSKIFDDYATMSSAPLAHISLPGSEPPDGVELIWKAISGSLGLN